jgi:Flp pilus assembly protein CpaB
VIAAFLTAAVAAVVLIVYLSNYRSTTDSEKTDTVITARSLLPRGSSGSQIASRGLFQAVNVKHKDVKSGAITDPSALRGQVTTTSIFPGEQITTSDLRPSAQSGVVDELRGHQRAVALPVDSTHGLAGAVDVGDHVDVYGAFGSEVRELAQNIVVLRPPTSPTGAANSGSGENVILQVSERLAGKLVFTAEYHKVWLTLRPPVGAEQDRRSTDVLDSVIK